MNKNKTISQIAAEARMNNIGSPFRVAEYVSYRFKGYSPSKALAKVKNKRLW